VVSTYQPTGRAWAYGKVVDARGGKVRQRLAHRLSLELALGRPLAPGMLACHTCDNPGCIRPSHLYEGSPRANHQDALRRNPTQAAIHQAITDAWRDAAAQARKGVA